MPTRRSSLTPAFEWNARSMRYVNAVSKRYVSREQVRQALDIALDRSRNEVARLSRELVNGRINLADWQTSVAREVKSMHMASAALAAGGWAQMTPQMTGRAGRIIRDEYAYLANFAQQIKSGQQKLDGSLVTRANLYAQAPRGTYHAIEEKGMQAQGKTECRNVLGPADHCDGCLTETAKGWVPIGALARIGSRLCLANCRCRLEYRDAAVMGAMASNKTAIPVDPARRLAEINERLMSDNISDKEFNSLLKEAERLKAAQRAASEAKLQQRAGTPQAVLEAERGIRSSDHETAYLYDKNGKLIAQQSGNKDTVNLSPAMLNQMRGSILTHNHPGGASFSRQDIAVAVNHGLAEVRAVTSERTYSMVVDNDKWNAQTWDRLNSIIKEHYAKKYDEYSVLVNNGTITEAQLQERFFHEVWQSVAQEAGGLKYSWENIAKPKK